MRKRQGISQRFEESQAGFTVIEVAVSAVIFVIILGAVYALLEVGRSDRFTTMQKTETIQNVRIALNTMGRDALNAGVGYENTGAQIPDNVLTLLNLAADADTDNDTLTPVVSGNNLNSVNGNPTDQVSFIFIDDSFNPTAAAASAPTAMSAPAPSSPPPSGGPANGDHSLPLNQLVASNQGVQLNSSGSNTATRVGDIYLIAGQSGWALGVLTGQQGTSGLVFNNTDALGINRPSATSPIRNIFPTNPTSCGANCIQITASASKVTWVTYNVVDDDGTGPGAGTLMRTVWGGASRSVTNPLAYGIIDMQVRYVLANGTVTDDPIAGPDGIAGNTDDDVVFLQTIRQVIVSVRVRSPEIDRRTNLPVESVLTSSFSTRNLVYEKQ